MHFVIMTTSFRTNVKKCLPPMLMAAAGVWLLAGCVFIPTFNNPVRGRDVSGQVGSPESKRPLRIDQARREDVLRVLGAPWATSPDGTELAYTWVVRNGVWVMPLSEVIIASGSPGRTRIARKIKIVTPIRVTKPASARCRR